MGAERLLAAEKDSQKIAIEIKSFIANSALAALEEYAAIPYANGDYERELLLDRVNDRYLLLTLGWEGIRRVYYPVINIDIREGKLWIQHDATEDGVATDLVAAGVPKERIVLAFYPVEARRHSEFAVA